MLLSSRVPPEIIFDEGLGRLFIVRVAGNIINPALLGSIEYASLHSTSRLIVVMGHEQCGAVGAAVNAFENRGIKEIKAINDIINKIMPAVEKAHKKTGAKGKALIEAAAKENVWMVIKEISKNSTKIQQMQKKEELKIIGAYYYLGSGKVDFWL